MSSTVEDGTFSLYGSQVVDFVRNGTWEVNDAKVRMRAKDDAFEVIKFLNYSASTTNLEAKEIFESLAKPINEKGEGITVDLFYNSQIDLTKRVAITKEPFVNESDIYIEVVVDLAKTVEWTDLTTGKTYAQSSSMMYGTHELGDAFDYFIKAVTNSGKTFGFSTQKLEALQVLYKNIESLHKNKDDKYGDPTDPLHEYFATVIQNFYAKGLPNEPIIPSYSGSKVDKKTQEKVTHAHGYKVVKSVTETTNDNE